MASSTGHNKAPDSVAEAFAAYTTAVEQHAQGSRVDLDAARDSLKAAASDEMSSDAMAQFETNVDQRLARIADLRDNHRPADRIKRNITQLRAYVDAFVGDYRRAPRPFSQQAKLDEACVALAAAEQALADMRRELERAVGAGDLTGVQKMRDEVAFQLPRRVGDARLRVLDLEIAAKAEQAAEIEATSDHADKERQRAVAAYEEAQSALATAWGEMDAAVNASGAARDARNATQRQLADLEREREAFVREHEQELAASIRKLAGLPEAAETVTAVPTSQEPQQSNVERLQAAERVVTYPGPPRSAQPTVDEEAAAKEREALLAERRERDEFRRRNAAQSA